MMNLKYFHDFVNEAKETKKRDKIKVVLLSNVSEESYTVPAMKAEFEKRGIPFRVIDVNTCNLVSTTDGSGNMLISDKNTKAFKINSDDTAILTRRGVVRSTFTRDIISKLEDNNFFVVNTLSSILACENKFTTSKILMDAGIPVPRMAIIENEDAIESGIKQIGGKFPVVLKMLSGSHGIGVSIIESLASLKSVLQTLWKIDSKLEVLIQEKIDSEYDLRIHVLTKKFNSPTPTDTDSILLGYMRRNRVKKDFRTNYSLGGTVEKTKVTKEQEKIAIEAAKAVGCNWCGVDLIVDKKTGKNYVLEVNSSPGTQGLKKATGVDVVADIVDFIQDKQNWIRSRRHIGFREMIQIPEIGQLVAKFDTGNGSLSCSLTYDEIDINHKEKQVKWKLGDRKFTNKIIGYANAEVGDQVHERPVIELDIVFAGKTYKAVHVSLVDRKDKSTKFLVNRKFMERIGCSVNPMKTFVVSSSPDGYSPAEAKGKPHLGIIFESKDQVLGGKGDEKSDSDFDKNELEIGSMVEFEHTKDPKIAKEIARDHLTEDPKYYSKLIKSGIVDEPDALKMAKELGWIK
jgi:ribosomal protein S6--L-glutamate ligase